MSPNELSSSESYSQTSYNKLSGVENIFLCLVISDGLGYTMLAMEWNLVPKGNLFTFKSIPVVCSVVHAVMRDLFSDYQSWVLFIKVTR